MRTVYAIYYTLRFVYKHQTQRLNSTIQSLLTYIQNAITSKPEVKIVLDTESDQKNLIN